MKRLLLLLPVLTFLASCSNEFEVAAPWKEVPVAYAILSPKDTAYYVRVEKAFLDPETNALQTALIPDSIYYPESAITVWLERTSTQSRVQLVRVDGTKEGIIRDPGTFATDPNWLYKLKPDPGSTLIPGETYRLNIERVDGKPPITAETTIPKDFTFVTPSPAQTPPFINFAPSSNTNVDWRADANAVLFNVYFIVRYREEAGNGTVLEHVTLEWKSPATVDRSVLSSGVIRGQIGVRGSDFYKFLSENIQPTTDRFRYFEPMSIRIEGGGQEINEFQITASANSGLTGAEVLPTYTNLSEGYGIFTAKNESTLGGIKVTTQTVDSMNINPLTFGLNFRY
ncbi:MAG: DUF4249 family protein [Lewinellaceae bacterium]|jgi:hypothetical protein|nr:DUF4249 family protein [Lewinellaceae bacterium]